MSLLKMLMGNSTHVAEKYWPAHDGTLNLTEARRGRGKSFGAVRIMLEWLKQRWAAIISGAARFAKVLSNIRFNLRRVAHVLLKMGVAASLQQALDVLKERVVYITSWDQVLTAYDSLILMDEANRNLNIYDVTTKQDAGFVNTVHDWLQQTRKHLLTLWFFVQDVSWIKNQVLSLTDRLWRAKRVRKKGTAQVRYFPWYGSDPFAKGKDGPLSRSADFKMRFDFDLWVARCYDTLQAVETVKKETQFRSFGDISDYMFAHALKPLTPDEQQDYPTWAEETEWFAKAAKIAEDQLKNPVIAWTATGGAVSPAVSPPRDDGGRGGAHVPDPLDLSTLPTSFPLDQM